MSELETQLDPRQHPDKDVYGVIGNPVAHSLSPMIHAEFAKQTQQAVYYGKLFSELANFKETVDTFFLRGGRGLNVTVPFKSDAYAMCQHHSDRAKAAGVVNIIWQKNGAYYGDNSDGIGLVKDIESDDFAIAGKRVLMIGAGGAVQGVILPFLEKKPLCIVIANRTLEKAQWMVKLFLPQAQALGIEISAISLEQIEQIQEAFQIIINGTSSGLSGDSPLTQMQAYHLAQLLKPSQEGLAYDMVYGKQTEFLVQMRSYGLTVKDGLGMLVEQAAKSFEVWRAIEDQGLLNTQGILEMLRNRLEPQR
jgi:shikimate dehydrogenase